MRLARDVVRRAVRVLRDDQELLRASGEVHLGFLGQNLDGLRAALGHVVELGAFQNPLPHELMFARAGFESLATFVRHLGQRLQKHQRVIYVHAVKAPA